MKKCLFLILIIFISIFLFNYKEDNKVKVNENIGEEENSNLAIMLETKFGSGTYKESSINAWPKDGYTFNDILSYCENGTTLEWDEEKDNVILKNVTKSDKCYIYFDKTILLADYIISLYTSDGINNLYYHDGKGNYANVALEAGDNSYRYAGGDYHLTDMAKQKGYDIFYDLIIKNCNGVNQKNNYWCDETSYYTLKYDQNKTNYSTLLNAVTKTIEDGYVKKEEVKNYICFGSNNSPCPKENLYRIIGIFKQNDGYQVKLITADLTDKMGITGNYSHTGTIAWVNLYLGKNSTSLYYQWNSNSWSENPLNLVNLNQNYLSYLQGLDSGEWFKKIADTIW